MVKEIGVGQGDKDSKERQDCHKLGIEDVTSNRASWRNVLVKLKRRNKRMKKNMKRE